MFICKFKCTEIKLFHCPDNEISTLELTCNHGYGDTSRNINIITVFIGVSISVDTNFYSHYNLITKSK